MRTHLSPILCLLVATTFLTSPAYAQGNNKLMSVMAAKTDAQRALLESIVGLKVKSESVVRDMVADHFTVDSKTSGVVKDIEFTDIVYDPEKDIAKAVARIKIGSVINIIGKRIAYKDAVIERVGFGTSTPANAAPLKAMRAAQVNAYQQLAEKVVGLQIDSATTVENYVLQSDEIKASVLAAIWGAQVVSYGWDASGDATVKMSIKANYVRDVLGQTFTGEQAEITVEGMGTSNETFSQGQDEQLIGSAAVREGSLSIPVSSNVAPQETGGAAAP